MKKLYIFDFDGMLADTVYDSIHCVNKALTMCGKPTYDKNLDHLIYKDFRKFLKDNNAGKETEVYTLYNKIYREYTKPNTHPYKGMIKTLQTLQDNNKILAICSNKQESYLKVYTKELFPTINFKYISGHREGIPNKPDPYRINEIIEKTGVSKDEVLYFGDKDADIEAAKRAGVDMVLARYGQGNKEDYVNPYPIKIIDTPVEILNIEDE